MKQSDFRSFFTRAGFILSLILLMPLFPVYGSGERIAILVDCEESNKPTLQMAERLQKDLRNILTKRGGYDVRILESRFSFRKGEGEYLIHITLIKYKPGSKAARLLVGFGAGSASLDIRYELFSPREKKLLSKNDGCGTSLDWQRIARKLNENILREIIPYVSEGFRPEAPAEELKAPPHRSGGDQEMEEALPSRPSPPKREKAGAPVLKKNLSGSATEQLRELEQMKNEGLITEEEYAGKRQEVLDRI